MLAAQDYNVRLEDVQNPETRAGVRAAARGDAALAEVVRSSLVCSPLPSPPGEPSKVGTSRRPVHDIRRVP